MCPDVRLGIHYLVSNVISLLALTLVRYGLADSWIWAKASRRTSTRKAVHYDIHGIVTVSSEVRLPGARALPGRRAHRRTRTIRVRLGRVAPRTATAELADPPFATARARAASASGVEIHAAGRHRGHGLAAPRALAARPLHERRRADPALDLRRARYALVHARLPRRRRARLPGHRAHRHRQDHDQPEDPRQQPYSFLSDDLTLVTPEGRVLTYPKPLTISRHTLRAVKTPLLSRARAHGAPRPEPPALTLGPAVRLRARQDRTCPAATINTIVQLLVPPPKFHVERLVPDVDVAPEARLAGMVVIERGGARRGRRSTSARRSRPCSRTARTPTASRRTPRSRASCAAQRHGPADRERAIVAHALSGLPATLIGATRWTGGAGCPAW